MSWQNYCPRTWYFHCQKKKMSCSRHHNSNLSFANRESSYRRRIWLFGVPVGHRRPCDLEIESNCDFLVLNTINFFSTTVTLRIWSSCFKPETYINDDVFILLRIYTSTVTSLIFYTVTSFGTLNTEIVDVT